MPLTRPTYSAVGSNTLTLRVVAATENIDMDGPQLSVSVSEPMLDTFTDQDIDDIAAVLANRLAAEYPTYYVAVEKSWTNTRGDGSRSFTHTP